MLKTCATIPVTDRTFSALKRVKIYTRNTIEENHLNELAMLRDIEIDIEEVIRELAKKNRRIDL